MKWSALVSSGILISALSAYFHPVMAQHHGNAARPATGGHTGGQVHPGNAGAGQIPTHVQRQMQQQMQHEQRMMQQQMQKMQQEAHRQYQQDVQRFEQWLKANGGKGGSGRLPNNPAEFDRWAATQKQRRAQGKSYDPMYDQYRTFAGSMGSSKSRQGHNQAAQSLSNPSQSAAKSTRSGQGQTQSAQSQSGQSQSGRSQSTARAGRRNNSQAGTSQAGTAGSTSANGGTTTAQGTKSTGSTQATGSTTGQEKHGELRHEERRLAELRHEERRLAELKHEERRLAELRREERILRERALARGVLAQDQAKVSLMRTVLSNLQRADHDYNGQREHAMNSLGQALNHLGSAVPPGVGASVGLGNMAQAQSDGILRDAVAKLRTVQSQLGGSASPAHHVLARASVGQAINHLEVALRVR